MKKNKLIEEVKQFVKDNGLDQELQSDDIVAAAQEFNEILKKYKDYIDRHKDRYIKLVKQVIELFYEPMPHRQSSVYRYQVFNMAVNALIIIGADEIETTKQFVEDFMDFMVKNKNVIEKVDEKIHDNIQEIVSVKNKPLNYSEDDIKEVIEEIKPIHIKNVSKDFRLYHGTSMENYRDIVKYGAIKTSNYANLNYDKIQDKEYYKAVYGMENGHIFLDAGLDIPIAFSSGGYRQNILYWSRKSTEEEIKRQNNDDALNSDGVIFVINPANYNLYYYNHKNEFMIDSEIKLEDTEVIFTHFRGGKVTFTDKEGKEIDLLHE